MSTSNQIIKVGLTEAPELRITFNGEYFSPSSSYTAGESIAIDADVITNPITFSPSHPNATFSIEVTIGIDFHWQRRETQLFAGSLTILPRPDGKLLAINEVEIEQYLLSVISSEMNPKAPLEFLKAHAVISRSWLLAQIHPQAKAEACECVETPERVEKWYDHSAHTLFHVCADDHCQRYQGLGRVTSHAAQQAIDSTRGEILTYEGAIADARFSKCCGGATEIFSTCWQPIDYKYLPAISDTVPTHPLPNLTNHTVAHKWIASRPEAFCNTADTELLATVLNGYDLETPDFYRWHVEYTPAGLTDILLRRTGIDYGEIISITPLHRGPSGRIDRLEIVGTKHRRIIGKELEIRRSLSRSHLYSSAFIVGQKADGTWVFEGAGWGHGVGLCQIGAAVMASKGFTYREILNHYFPGTQIEKI